MFYNDHEPPHFHARYGRARAVVRVSDGEIMSGELSPTARRMVREWTLRGVANWRKIGVAPARNSLSRRFPAPMQTKDLPMVDVLRLRPLEGGRLWLRFTDGSEGVRDLSDVIALDGEMVRPLKDPEYFARVFVEMGAPTWPNGFDLDPINLYRAAGALMRRP